MKLLKFLMNLPIAAYRCLKAQMKYLRTKKLRSFEEQTRVRNICQPCVFREGFKCGECGCFLEEKIAMEDQVCPVGFWEEDDD